MRAPRLARWTRCLAVSCALSLAGCAGPQAAPPPVDPPVAPAPVIPQGANDLAPPAAYQLPPAQLPAPVSQAPTPTDLAPIDGQLGLPNQGPLSLGVIQAGCPASIPAAQAGQFLSALNQGPLFNAPPGDFALGAAGGCFAGAIPDLVNYGVFAQLMYYPFHSVWVPYILVDHSYYPYAWVPRFDDRWVGHCYYPVMVFQAGCYYPFVFYDTYGGFGYPDWEYNWLPFRQAHADYDWDQIGSWDDRPYGREDFQRWRSGRPVSHRDNWQPSTPPRRNGSGGKGHGDNPAPRDQGGNPAPRDRGSRAHDSQDRAATLAPSAPPTPRPNRPGGRVHQPASNPQDAQPVSGNPGQPAARTPTPSSGVRSAEPPTPRARQAKRSGEPQVIPASPPPKRSSEAHATPSSPPPAEATRSAKPARGKRTVHDLEGDDLPVPDDEPSPAD